MIRTPNVSTLIVMLIIPAVQWLIAGTPGRSGIPVTTARDWNTSGSFFVANHGQVLRSDGMPATDVLFTLHEHGATLFFNANGISYVFSRGSGSPDAIYAAIHGSGFDTGNSPWAPAFMQVQRTDMRLIGANAAAVRGDDPATYFENFYLPHCPNGILDVPAYRRLVYESVYPGIDLVYYTSTGGMKYDFVVHPGANIEQIGFAYRGASNVRLDRNGCLTVRAALGSVTEQRPRAWQGKDGRLVRTEFTVRDGRIRFSVGNYDRRQTLIIDPALVWSTFLGGERDNLLYGVAVDSTSDTCIVIGQTTSIYLPTDAAGNPSNINANFDAIVTSLDGDGHPVWSSFIGSQGRDAATCVSLVPGTRSVVVGGYYNCYCSIFAGWLRITDSLTRTNQIPWTNNGVGIYGGFDWFLVKLNLQPGQAGRILWGKTFGGDGDEFPTAISCTGGDTGSIRVVGLTSSRGLADPFPTNMSGSFGGPTDGLLVLFNSDGRMFRGTYIGGDTGRTVASAVATDSLGNIIVAGYTKARHFPADSAALTALTDVFVAYYPSSLDSALWIDRTGGSGSDNAFGATAVGNVAYIVGETSSGDFAGPNTHASDGSLDGFIMRYDSLPLRHRAWVWLFGGKGDDAFNGVAVRRAAGPGSGTALVAAGYTRSSTLGPTAIPDTGIIANNLVHGSIDGVGKGKVDGMIAFVTASDTGLVPRTLAPIGGPESDDITAVAYGRNGRAWITGYSDSYDFPTTNGAFAPYPGYPGFMNDIHRSGRVDSSFDGFAMMLEMDSTHGITIRRGGGNPAGKVVSAFPNPARTGTHVSFTLPAADVVTVALYSSEGRRVAVPIDAVRYKQGEHTEMIDLHALPAGNYVLVTQAGSAIATQLLSVVR